MGPIQRACVLCAVLVASTYAQPPLPPHTWPIAAAPEALRPLLARADLIVVAMHDSLLRELRTALQKGGPAQAVNSCHIDVAGITRRLAGTDRVAAGRTGDRLRSAANAPRAWAAPLVTTHAGRQARDVDGFVVDLGGSIGVLRPIAHQRMCTPCHGPADRLDAGVRDILRARYPSDRATGFKDGEIRGWYWVEIPKAGR